MMESNESFEMVAKTLAGLEEVLAEELRTIGAINVQPGRRMVSFEGDLEMLYRSNFCCRTALRILKPFYKFQARTPDELYDAVRAFDWDTILSPEKTFSIDTVAFGDEFTHSRYATYRVKDAIVDFFKDKYGQDKRPGVRLENADIFLNLHISGENVTLSLDSSGESLHKRGYRTGGQTEAPLSEVLAAGIILLTGYRGDTPFVDPMCGSGTFLIEAALIAANIYPGVFRKNFAFETWPDFDRELFESIYNDDSKERTPEFPIIGGDISPRAVEIARENLKGAGVSQYVQIEQKPFSAWEEAPQPAGILVTNPPYGKRISAPDMENLYRGIGDKLKRVFTGYHAWILGYSDDYFRQIALSPSQKLEINNGGLDCELREYVMFEGFKKDFRAAGGVLKTPREEKPQRASKGSDRKESKFGKDRKFSKDDKKRPFDKDRKRSFDKDSKRPFDKDRKRPFDKESKRPFDKDRKRPFDKESKRPERKVWRAPKENDNQAGAERRRPLDISKFGRGPQLPPEKEAPLE